MNHVFPYHQLDFVNFASRPIIMEICKEFRVEWESVVFFCMNENVGEERGEKEERAEEWWWWWWVVWWCAWCCVCVVWCGVLWCGGVCLCAAQQISIKGVYTAMALRCHTKGTAKSGACDVIRLNTGKLTKF